MEGEFGTQDYKMQILVDLKSQNLEAWMAKHCLLTPWLRAIIMLITSHYISISVKLTGTQKHITGN